MTTIEILDVTLIEPRLKHPTIFNRFDSLDAGEGFVIHNDHDPKPLYYQLLAERGETFQWQYLEEGPEYWKVRITRKGANESSPTIGEIVSKDYRKAEVFKKLGLDFCCGGKKSLKKACAEHGLDIIEVERQLQAVEIKPVKSEQNYAEWDLGFLADYIVNTHHRYVAESLPVLYEYTQKVARVHGERHPEAIKIADLFEEVMHELDQHMLKEEEILFPYIKKLSETGNHETMLGTIKNPIKVMEVEHEEVGALMSRIRQLSSEYTPPAGACNTFRISYAKLKEFEEDLHQHIHLENNILFPSAIKLENEFLR